MEIRLYESGTTRSARCRWTLQEAGLPFEAISRQGLGKTDEVLALRPLGKLPLAVIDGKPLFESAAICTYIADHSPDVDLIAKPGSWGRGQHDQWVSYVLTEMESWLWNTGVNRYVLPEEQRITAGFAQNDMMFRQSAAALDKVLQSQDWLVEGRFTVTDIICGWTVNWGRRQGLLEGFDALQTYLMRLLARPACALAKD